MPRKPRAQRCFVCRKEGAMSYHGFPTADVLLNDLWRKFCLQTGSVLRPQDTTKYLLICHDHFKDSDFVNIDKARASQRNNTKKFPMFLKRTAIPSVFEGRLFPVSEGNLDFPNRAPITLYEDNSTASSNESSRDQQESQHDDAISITISNQMCRLCLGEKAEMWALDSVLTFDDQSTLDVVQAFQHLTRESTEQIANPKLPGRICKSCLDLLVSAYTFQQKYEGSNQVLIEFLSKNCSKTTPHSNTEDIIQPEEGSDADESSNFLDENEVVTVNRPLVTVKRDEDLIAPVSPKKETTEHNEKVEVARKLHRCPICMKKFTALELKRHCQSHKALKSYLKAAPRFNKKVRFYAKANTKNTCLFYRDAVLHNCPFCVEEFDGEQFKEHVKQHRIEGNFRCNICNRIFLGRNHLKQHQLSHKQEAPFKCQECGKGFFRQKNFHFHKLTHTASDDLPFKCRHCPKTFSNPEHLKRHSFRHEKFISYQQYYRTLKKYVSCKQCLQKFKTKEELKEHNCRFCCAKCHKIFDDKKQFSAHVCKYKLKPAQCGPCGKVFQLSSSYSTHKHRCAYTTLCYLCGKKVSNMTQHLLSHYPQKRRYYTCAHCGKQFRYKQNIDRHVNDVHLKIVSFQCQYCSKGFKTKWNLTVHERIHIGEKKHVCSICGKGFLEKSYLDKHLRLHIRKGHYIQVQDADTLLLATS